MTYKPLCKECGVYHDGYENCATMTAQTNTLSDELVERLRDLCRDWNGEPIVNESTPRCQIYCGEIREIITGIERIQEEARKCEERAFKDGFVLGFDHRGRTDDQLEAVNGAIREWECRAALSADMGERHNA